jgi:hypothetical protein
VGELYAGYFEMMAECKSSGNSMLGDSLLNHRINAGDSNPKCDSALGFPPNLRRKNADSSRTRTYLLLCSEWMAGECFNDLNELHGISAHGAVEWNMAPPIPQPDWGDIGHINFHSSS